MSRYRKKISRGLNKLSEISNRLNESDSNESHEICYELQEVENLLINPLQTIPTERYIQITTSFCDEGGSAYKSHDDEISFNREISPALLYTMLNNHIKNYNNEYRINSNIQELENWLNEQQGLLFTVNKYDCHLIEDTGLTVFDTKTEHGSIGVFIEYGINYN